MFELKSGALFANNARRGLEASSFLLARFLPKEQEYSFIKMGCS